jgi:hypothetical protein
MDKDPNKKYAQLVLELKAQTGYHTKKVEIISENQWRDINLVLRGKLKSEIY